MTHRKDASYDFGRQVRAGIRALWKGYFDLIGFVDHMSGAIFRSYELAWREGESQCDRWKSHSLWTKRFNMILHICSTLAKRS